MDERQGEFAKLLDICAGLVVQCVQTLIEKAVEQRGEAGREAVLAFLAEA